MEDQRKNELAVVIAATVVFGFMNRILIRIPYMVLGDFSFSFLISVVTWWIYNSVLFSVAEQMQMGDGGKKRIGKIVLFGFLATLIKAGIDTCIDLTVARQPNMLLLVAAMEMSMILYIAGLDYFLFVKVGKRKIKQEGKEINALVTIFVSLLIFYGGTLFYYLKQVNYAVERYGTSSMVQEIGLDNAIWNMTTMLGRRSTTVGAVVYVGCFIIIWWILEKITVSQESN